MKCFNHHERDGVAICPACGRGLCTECTRDTGESIVCNQQCADLLVKRKTLFSDIEAHLKGARRASFLGSLFSIVMGILFILFSNMGFGIVYDFVLVLGIGFTVYGIVALLASMIIFLRQREKEASN